MGFVADAAYLTLCHFHVRSEVVSLSPAIFSPRIARVQIPVRL